MVRFSRFILYLLEMIVVLLLLLDMTAAISLTLSKLFVVGLIGLCLVIVYALFFVILIIDVLLTLSIFGRQKRK